MGASADIRTGTARDALERLSWSGDAVILLETGRIVVMPYEAGVRHWKRWWADRR